MATRKLNLSELLSESFKIANSDFRHYLPHFLLFILPFSISIVVYPALQHSLSTHKSNFYLPFPFSGDPFVFKPLGLFFLYLFTLLCLSTCAIATISYSLYHGFSSQPMKFSYTIRSLSGSFIRLFATFFCAHAIILAGLVVIRLIVFGVTREIEYIGFEIQYDSVSFLVFYVLGWVLLGLGLLYMHVDWILAPVIVVVESSWGFEPLRRSACLVKGNRGLAVRLLLCIYGLACLTVFGFGNWGQLDLFGPRIYESALILGDIGFGSYILSKFLLWSLIAITILYINCKALHGDLPEEIEDKEDINQEYISLPLDEEKVVSVV